MMWSWWGLDTLPLFVVSVAATCFIGSILFFETSGQKLCSRASTVSGENS